MLAGAHLPVCVVGASRSFSCQVGIGWGLRSLHVLLRWLQNNDFNVNSLAVELEVLLGYQAGHSAFLMSPVTQKDLEEAERARSELLLVSVPVHQLVMTVMGILDLAGPLQEGHGVTPVAIDPSWVVGELADVVRDLKAVNPYLKDRELRSLSVDIPLGPDWREQHLHSVTASADQVQARKDTQASGLEPLLPRGLPPGKYAVCAAALVTRQIMEVALPDDLKWANRSWCASEVCQEMEENPFAGF